MRHDPFLAQMPGWVPDPAQRYLLHTVCGIAIRDIARRSGCHASTVLRQIRRVETRRDDPLIDTALVALARDVVRQPSEIIQEQRTDTEMTAQSSQAATLPDCTSFNRDALRVLRRLCEAGAVLAVAENMEKAVVVRDDPSGRSTRTAVVEAETAQAMSLNGWIACSAPGRISRYYITASGRSALSRLLAEDENRQRSARESGMAEAQAPYDTVAGRWGDKTVQDPETERPRRVRYNMAESPLVALARRRDRDGRPFLEDALVRAGERLREDFELAQMGPRVTQNWDKFLTGGARGPYRPESGVLDGPSSARDRVARALSDLGPGLSDVALRCCCFLEGLETAERRLGWSARSGKIVLRIALQRLQRHYESPSAPSRMIG
ncbi:DUF6456 domain-containing protein [Albibacillus kandeliae]|uniref:DUF6456 domain-containing protein n=1 Tax=Albibacillus kandeliae TaxID=2174228 RepID=UPI000D6855E2|nr:DUF6456 domain-containing protein [Albibacillus kandeliae]